MKYDYLHLTKTQVALIAILVFALELPLSLLERRIDVRVLTSDLYVTATYTGLPFETMKITDNITSEEGVEWHSARERSRYRFFDPRVSDPHHQPVFTVTRTVEYLWNGIILNTILLITFSTTLVKLSTRVLGEIEYRRYYKT